MTSYAVGSFRIHPTKVQDGSEILMFAVQMGRIHQMCFVQSSTVSHTEFAGIMAGMLVIGIVADLIGRKKAGILTCLFNGIGDIRHDILQSNVHKYSLSSMVRFYVASLARASVESTRYPPARLLSSTLDT